MKPVEAPESIYALGHSKSELERLSLQAQMYEPFTRQVLLQAGIAPGMRVLDVGCGSGDVSFLVAELVGDSGEVIGVDRSTAAVQWASARAQARERRNVNFLEGDPTIMAFDRPFDAVVGRVVLMYYPDPVDALRRLMERVRKGGLIIFQEIDFASSRSMPPTGVFDHIVTCVGRALSATGAHLLVGPQLYSIFSDAGLPGPSMRMDCAISGGEESRVVDVVAEVARSLLPTMEKLNIASAAEVDMSTLAQRMRDEVIATKGVVLSSPLIGAWSRKLA